MVRQLKYIRFESGFVVFSEPTLHSEVKIPGNIISAGFVRLRSTDDKDLVSANCYGKSVSLGKDSKEEDSQLLTNQLNQEWS